MTKQQFTISPDGMITINPDGVVIIDRKRPPAPGRDYSKQPVQAAIRHDLTLELHGERFSARAKLTPGQALGLMSVLAYLLREELEFKRGVK
jgi:hypothetical protein